MDTTRLNIDILHDEKYSVFNRFRRKIKKRKFGYYNNLTKLNPAGTNL